MTLADVAGIPCVFSTTANYVWVKSVGVLSGTWTLPIVMPCTYFRRVGPTGLEVLHWRYGQDCDGEILRMFQGEGPEMRSTHWALQVDLMHSGVARVSVWSDWPDVGSAEETSEDDQYRRGYDIGPRYGLFADVSLTSPCGGSGTAPNYLQPPITSAIDGDQAVWVAGAGGSATVTLGAA